MPESAISRFLASHPVGAIVWVKPEHLSLDPDAFDAAVRTWSESGGGSDFEFISAHPESQSGGRRFDMAKLKRTR